MAGWRRAFGADRRTAQPTLGSGAEAASDAGSTGPDLAIDASSDVAPGEGAEARALPADASAD
jgi:hypothetical protein